MSWWETTGRSLATDVVPPNWLDTFVLTCPRCKSTCTKREGTNASVCVVCRASLCSRCGAYTHAGSPCSRVAIKQQPVQARMLDGLNFMQLLRVQQRHLPAERFRTKVMQRVMQRWLAQGRSLEQVRLLQRAIDEFEIVRQSLLHACVFGVFREFHKQAIPHRLRTAIVNAASCLTVISEYFESPSRSIDPEHVATYLDLLRKRFSDFKADLLAIKAKLQNNVQPVQQETMIVRRAGAAGKRIKWPQTLAQLLTSGSAALGIEAIVARDRDGYIIQESELSELPNEVEVRLFTKEEEA